MIDLNNESGLPADELGLVALTRFALERLRVHPQADVSILLVDEQTMTDYHVRFMDEPGPTDVLSFPMDELRPPRDDEDPPMGRWAPCWSRLSSERSTICSRTGCGRCTSCSGRPRRASCSGCRS